MTLKNIHVAACLWEVKFKVTVRLTVSQVFRGVEPQVGLMFRFQS